MEVTSLCIFNLFSLLLSKNGFLNSGAVCVSFINPTPYLEIGYFLPFLNRKCRQHNMNCFSSYSLTFLLFLLFIIRKKCMFDVKIKWKSFKYVEIESKMPLKSHKSLYVLCIIKINHYLVM